MRTATLADVFVLSPQRIARGVQPWKQQSLSGFEVIAVSDIMLFFLFSLGLSKTIADIEPPIELDSDGTVNLWEFSGSATVYPDSVMLLPPIQFRRGCGWTTVDIPKQSFGITFDLVISDGDRGSALGIWMIDKYAQDGPLAGGPSVFNGIGLILSVKRI